MVVRTQVRVVNREEATNVVFIIRRPGVYDTTCIRLGLRLGGVLFIGVTVTCEKDQISELQGHWFCDRGLTVLNQQGRPCATIQIK